MKKNRIKRENRSEEEKLEDSRKRQVYNRTRDIKRINDKNTR